MRILFMGTPEFAAASFKALVEAGHEICAVFSQPDKPKNRGMKLLPTPVKELALTYNIPVFQPRTLRDGTALAQVKTLAPELIVVAAYGKLLPKELLDCPPRGCINVHSSLLPRYRGAAPIHWAVLNGEQETGVTIMHMDVELDAGDIIAQASTPIDPDEPVTVLHDRLAALGAGLLADTVAQLAQGTARRTPQDAAQATYAPMLSRELSRMDWSRPARALHNQVRGLIPWPAATAELDGVRCKLLATAVAEETSAAAPGTVVQADKHGLKIVCGAGSVLEVKELQPDGKKRMTAAAFLLGHPMEEGSAVQ